MPLAQRRRGRPGFTLLELLTVLAVIAILGAITLTAIHGVRQRVNIARAKAELAALATALEEFRRHHGDYPQLGEYSQAPVTPAGANIGPGLATAQAKLFNCLTGLFGAREFGSPTRLNGPNFLDAGRFSLNGTLTNRFHVPASPQSAAVEENIALLDPWGRRYLYYYKDARNPAQWQAPGYVLYSAGARIGANGDQTPLAPHTGLFPALPTPGMADNIYANP
jgi:prepilin-type N-terminal cleavage/methylation domain-containing protein